MIIFYAPFVKETTTTTGTGSYSLNGSVGNARRFSDIVPNGSYVCYCCTDTDNFELAIGNLSGGILSRTTIVSSSNNDSVVNWGAGTREIFITYPPSLFNMFSAKDGFNSYKPYSGSNNDISGDISFCLGNDNNISGVSSIILGGYGLISGDFSLGLGFGHNISGSGAIALGQGGASRIGNNIVFSTGYFSAEGDSQGQRTYGRGTTSDATPTTLSSEMEPGAGTTGTLLLEVRVLATQIDGSGVGDAKSWRLEALVKYVSETPTLVGSITSTVIAASAGASSWSATLDFSATAFVKVTGEASKNIRWVCEINALDLSYSIDQGY